MLNKLNNQLNPIIIKELRSRMRGPRPFLTLTGMLVVLAGITYGVYRLAVSYFNYYTGVPLSPQIGQMLFTMLSFLLLLFICIITPAVTSNAVSSEKENLTYEMLLTTPLHPAKILWGKLFSAMSYVFLLIFAAIPIASLIFVFGGVTLRDMVKAIVILIVIAVATGVFGLFMSTLLKRSARATVISYVLIAALILGSLVVYGMVGVLTQQEPPRWILILNPVSALASAMTNVSANNYSMGFIPILGADFRAISGQTWSIDHIPRPLYHYSVPLYTFLSVILYAITTRLILPTRRWKISRRDVLIFMGIIFTLTAVIIIGLFATINNYERAAAPDNSGMFTGPMGGKPMIEPAIREVVVAEVEPVPAEVLEIADTELSNIYGEAFSISLGEWQNTFAEDISTIYLVQTLSTLDNQQTDYTISDKVQKSISKQIQDLSFESKWADTLDEAVSQTKDHDPEAIIIVFSTLAISTNNTADSTIFGYQRGEIKFEFKYTVTREENNWLIIESESLFYKDK